MAPSRHLLSIVEMGGYPDFAELYQAHGYQVSVASSMRKAMQQIKKRQPDVIVAEFNFQSDFRDRTSSLESLMARVQQLDKPSRVIVFYEAQQRPQLERLLAVFSVFKVMPFPVNEKELSLGLEQATEESLAL